MKTIEERAKLASEGYDDDGYSAGLYMGYVVGATEQKAIDEEVRLQKCDDMTEDIASHFNRIIIALFIGHFIIYGFCSFFNCFHNSFLPPSIVLWTII